MQYSNYHSKPSESLWYYCRDEPNDDVTRNSESFKSRIKITVKTHNTGNTKDVEIAVRILT